MYINPFIVRLEIDLDFPVTLQNPYLLDMMDDKKSGVVDLILFQYILVKYGVFLTIRLYFGSIVIFSSKYV